MGDFNTDLTKISSRSRRLRSILESTCISILPLTPTHVNTDTDDTWLDLMLISASDSVLNHGQLAVPGISRHDLIYLSYKMKPPKQQATTITMRNFTKLNLEDLNSDAQVVDWSSVLLATNVDDKVAHFNNSVLDLFNKHAPLKAVRVKRPPAPWITSALRRAMERRNCAFRKYRRDRSENNWNLYKLARNRCNQMVRAAKRRYIFENVQNTSSADIWKFLKTLGVTEPASNSLPSNLSLFDLNQHFSKTTSLPDSVKSKTISDISSRPPSSSVTFGFSPVTDDEVHKTMIAIKSKAIGCDGIGRVMLFSLLSSVLPVLTHIMNASLLSGVFPNVWRKAIVIPLPKVPNPCLVNHFRPISILPFLSKILESLVHHQISVYIYSRKLLSPYQSGFRRGHSTSTALLKVTEDIRAGMEGSRLTVLVLIDFSNAFNTVDHDILLAILSQIGLTSSARDWFSSYLRGRQQAVRVTQESSDWCTLATGVPQGGIISPLLFSLFINSITKILHCSYHLYADDLQIYAQGDIENLDDCITCINADLAAVADWSRKFGVEVNVSKCQAILVGSPYYIKKISPDRLKPLLYDTTAIPLSPQVKDLGLYIDDTLRWNKQITHISQSVTSTLRALYRFKHFLPSSTKTLLVQSLVLPIIDYADVCSPDLSQESLNKLDRLLNNTIRFIFGLRKYDHISFFRSKLNWLPIRQRRSLRSLCLLFSILNDPHSPEYLKSYFRILGNSHSLNLRSSANLLLECPLHHSGFLSHSFVVSTIKLWNALPLNIKKSPSKFSFKRSVKKFYLASPPE